MGGFAPVCGSNSFSVLPFPSYSPSYLLLVLLSASEGTMRESDCRGEKSSSGAGCHLQGDLQYDVDSVRVQTNQRSRRIPEIRTDGGWLMTQPSPKHIRLSQHRKLLDEEDRASSLRPFDSVRPPKKKEFFFWP